MFPIKATQCESPAIPNHLQERFTGQAHASSTAHNPSTSTEFKEKSW